LAQDCGSLEEGWVAREEGLKKKAGETALPKRARKEGGARSTSLPGARASGKAGVILKRGRKNASGKGDCNGSRVPDLVGGRPEDIRGRREKSW